MASYRHADNSPVDVRIASSIYFRTVASYVNLCGTATLTRPLITDYIRWRQTCARKHNAGSTEI